MKNTSSPLSRQAKPDKDGVGNAERAFWTFLSITLIAPFLAAIIILVASLIAAAVGRGPASLLALDRAGQLGWAAQKAVEAYVWCAIPAGIAAAATALAVYRMGTLNWLTGASIGAIAASIMAFVSGGMMQQHITPMAAIGAVVGIAMVGLLRRARIIT